MKEHILTMVFLGLLFLMFKSPFPNRLLETDTVEQEEKIHYPQNENSDYLPYEIEETIKDSLYLSPGAAAFLEEY